MCAVKINLWVPDKRETSLPVTSEEAWRWKRHQQAALRSAPQVLTHHVCSPTKAKRDGSKTHPADCAVFKDDPHRIGDYNYVTRGSANDLHVFELMGCEGHLPAPVSGLQAQQALTQLAARSAVCANK